VNPHEMPPGSGLAGRLQCASPFELGQFLLLGRKTGVLHLSSGDKRGELHVLEGQIVSAAGPDLSSGQAAAMEMLKWTEGDFHFVAEPVPPSEEIDVGTENLLLETARLMDESGQGERQVAASLEAADELSRTFAAITAQAASTSPAAAGSARGWLLQSPGRSLAHMTGHPLMGVGADGGAKQLDAGTTPDPGRVLGRAIEGPPRDEWVSEGGRRLYLSWGSEGYRLVCPYPTPAIEKHIPDHEAVGSMLCGATAVGIFGPSATGKSLLAALLATAQAGDGFRVLYVTGVPTHDLGDGQRILHVVTPPGAGAAHAQEALERWHPEAVVVDAEPSREMAVFIQHCRRGGIPLVMTLRASDGVWARKSVQFLLRETAGWKFLTPEVTSAGPRLRVSQEAA
jgi:hypothetical protein